MVAAIALAAVSGTASMDLKFISSGVSRKMGYIPMRAELKDEPAGIKKLPLGLKRAKFGSIVVGNSQYAFILDEPLFEKSTLYVDSNHDGDLTNDPTPRWSGTTAKGMTMYMGTAEVVFTGQKASLGVYRFDRLDPDRAALKNTLLWYADFGYQGKAEFGKDTFDVEIAGLVDGKSRIWVDRNGNGKSDGRSESISAAKPFNFGGTTYELTPAKDTFEIHESTKKVAEIPLPPDLAKGRPVPTFSATTMDGGKVNFPSTYKGRVVMIDFWATWCGPCTRELPTVLKAYGKYHDKGLDLLGVSFDEANMTDKVTAFAKAHDMTWSEIYEGKFWETTIGKQFGVEAIPFSVLVDGDTGQILASGNAMRGESLEKTLEGVFAARH